MVRIESTRTNGGACHSFQRDTLALITPDASSGYAVWTPDGTALTFTSDRAGPVGVFRQAMLGQAPVDPLAAHPNTTLVGSWSPDGAEMLVTVISPDTLGDIAVVRPGVDGAPGTLRLLIETAADDYSPQFSPDGRWFAYCSFESGQTVVYVQSYPDLAVREVVGTAGDESGQPLWSRDGRELFFRQEDRMMVVPVALGNEISIGRARALFDFPQGGDLEGITGYDVAPDGGRFVMVRPAARPESASRSDRILVVLNWFEELKQRVPTGR